MTGPREGPSLEPQSATDMQRADIRAYFVALGLAAPERYLIILSTGCESGKLADLSETQAGQVLEVCHEATRPRRLP